MGEDGSVNADRSRGLLICQNSADTFNAEPAGPGESTVVGQEVGDTVESQVTSFNCWRDEALSWG